MDFRGWAPGEKLEKGTWNIPVLEAGETILPYILVALVPCSASSGSAPEHHIGYPTKLFAG